MSARREGHTGRDGPLFGGERVVAIVRADAAHYLAAVVATLIEGGLRAIELPLTTPGALDALETLVDRHRGEATLGVGTVLDAHAAEEAISAGAAFVVSPALSSAVMEVGRRSNVPIVPGALTPTEIVACWEQGAAAVKLFPASLGGPAYLGALRAPLPHIPIVPTGGIRLDQVAAYLSEGAVAVGLGLPLIGDAAAGGSLTALSDRVSELMSTLRQTVAGGVGQ